MITRRALDPIHRPPTGRPSAALSAAFNFSRATRTRATKITKYESRRCIYRWVLDTLECAPAPGLSCAGIVFLFAGIIYVCTDADEFVSRRRARKCINSSPLSIGKQQCQETPAQNSVGPAPAHPTRSKHLEKL